MWHTQEEDSVAAGGHKEAKWKADKMIYMVKHRDTREKAEGKGSVVFFGVLGLD